MNVLTSSIKKAIFNLYQLENIPVELQYTRKEFSGNYTLVCFPYTKATRQSPDVIGENIGKYLLENESSVVDFNVVKGFLNITLSDEYWKNEVLAKFESMLKPQTFGHGQRVMVEFCSPNTNKPLHLGHLRNLLLGDSLSRILTFCGYEVVKANLYNDRGAHICKSMLAWKKFAQGATPQSTGLKGDAFVVQYYVMAEGILKTEGKALLALWETGNFEGVSEEVQQQYNLLQEKLQKAQSVPKPDAKKIEALQGDLKELAHLHTAWFKEVQQLLQAWENQEPEVISLWKQMNAWVYEGFENTYNNLGISFDTFYYESDTYKLGKDLIALGLQKGVFYKKEDGSVWIDLTAEKLDHKLVLRSNGTSVYITQDMGTALKKQEEYNLSRSLYVVASEQDYHFKVLFLILKKLGFDWAEGLHHLSYGMVYLPTGRMKTSEGKVVDADALLQEMTLVAQKTTEALGKTEGMNEQELQKLYHRLGISAIKYYLLKVDPQKDMEFNPEESIDFHGNTGTYLQYTYARIHGIVRKIAEKGLDIPELKLELYSKLEVQERNLLVHLSKFNDTLEQAANQYSPALLANYAYELGRLYGQFHHEVIILHDENTQAIAFRVKLNETCGTVLGKTMELLGITPVERM